MTPPAPPVSPLFRCEFCNASVASENLFCPSCRIALDAGQLLLRRANVLLEEAGSWRRTGLVPRPIADRLLDKYRRDHDAALRGLAGRSPEFQSATIPVAAFIASPAVPPPPHAPAVPPPPHAPAVPPPPHAPAVPPPPHAPAVPPPPHAPAVPPPPHAPAVVVSLSPAGEPRVTAPRVIPARPAAPPEDLLFGVLSERHLNVLASAGVFAVFVAVVLLVYKGWEGYANTLKVGMIAAAVGAVTGLGALIRGKTVLKATGNALFILGNLSTPGVFAAAAWYDLLPVSDSLVGLAGAACSAALYAGLSRREGLGWFSWLSVASVVAGHGCLLDVIGVKGGNLAPGYGVLGAALAAGAVWKRRTELLAGAAAVLVGSMVACVPLVLMNEIGAVPGLVGAAAMAAGFAVLSALNDRWMHGAWIAAGGAAMAACRAADAAWPVWPASLSLVGALSLGAALWRRPRTEPLLAGGAVLLLVSAILAALGYPVSAVPARDQALLAFAAIAAPALAATAWRRTEPGWALAGFLLPGVAFFALKNLLGLPHGWLPVGLGAYAAGLYALGRGENVFSKAATPVAVLSHIAAFLLCCNPGASVPDVVDPRLVSQIPWYWGESAWKGALAMALPGFALLAARVRREPLFLYGAQPSLLAALVFAAHELGLSGAW
ncbi:MAG: hypothetical protein IT452_23165, partial [Planctomycetia bacterium]|nr:hypothetical protein [Planctomycetia bacterium]